MNRPVRIRLQITALGTFLRGLRASPPIVDAASKPTSEKMQTTTEKSSPLRLKPLNLSWLESIGEPCLKRMKQDSARMQATDRPSSTSVRIADRRTSLKAMTKPTAALIANRRNGETVPCTPMPCRNCSDINVKPHRP